MNHSPKTEFHFSRRATSIGWASLGPNRSLRSCDMWLQNFKLSEWFIRLRLSEFHFRLDEPLNVPLQYTCTSLLFTNPQVCSDFLTLLAAWEISRISVRNRFERDVCSQVSREVSKSSISSAIFRKRGHHYASFIHYNLSNKSMRQSGSLVTRLSNVGQWRILSRSVVFYSRFLCGDLFGYSAYFYKFCRMKDFYKNRRISKLM